MTTPVESPPHPPSGRGAALPAIGADRVSKSYAVGRQQVAILHEVSLEVGDGEMVAVMGPSGSGKSTLLYCLAGLESPTSGGVALAGRPLGSLSRTDLARMRRSEVGFVFQSYNLMPTLTAYENVALPFRLQRRRPPADEVEGALARVGLAGRLHALPSAMSGGEQQRVALARVLAQRPAVVFADEPTGALDTRSGALVLDELTAVAHEPGRCVLVVTHDPGVAARCDRVLFMSDGRLVRELVAGGAEEVARVLAALSAGREA